MTPMYSISLVSHIPIHFPTTGLVLATGWHVEEKCSSRRFMAFTHIFFIPYWFSHVRIHFSTTGIPPDIKPWKLDDMHRRNAQPQDSWPSSKEASYQWTVFWDTLVQQFGRIQCSADSWERSASFRAFDSPQWGGACFVEAAAPARHRCCLLLWVGFGVGCFLVQSILCVISATDSFSIKIYT